VLRRSDSDQPSVDQLTRSEPAPTVPQVPSLHAGRSVAPGLFGSLGATDLQFFDVQRVEAVGGALACEQRERSHARAGQRHTCLIYAEVKMGGRLADRPQPREVSCDVSLGEGRQPVWGAPRGAERRQARQAAARPAGPH
jgi:hypothetical protein